MAGLLSRLVERLTTEHSDDADLQDRAAASGCTRVDAIANRDRGDIHGVLRSVSIRPVDDVTALEAELYDGTGSVTLVWLGRRRINGITPGRTLTASGRIGLRGKDRVMYNPGYRLDG